jgi:hypothetical protein
MPTNRGLWRHRALSRATGNAPSAFVPSDLSGLLCAIDQLYPAAQNGNSGLIIFTMPPAAVGDLTTHGAPPVSRAGNTKRSDWRATRMHFDVLRGAESEPGYQNLADPAFNWSVKRRPAAGGTYALNIKIGVARL